MTMTVQSAIDLLRASLATLLETVHELALAVDDVPAGPSEPAILDAMRNWLADVEGDLQEAFEQATSFTSDDSFDVRGSGRRLATCHVHFNAALRRFRSGLGSPASAAELQQVAAERAGSWRPWSRVVQQAVERCELRALDAGDALLACWRETTDHAVAAVSLTTTNIGQNIAPCKEGDSHAK
jgi:hypothetical protein